MQPFICYLFLTFAVNLEKFKSQLSQHCEQLKEYESFSFLRFFFSILLVICYF